MYTNDLNNAYMYECERRNDERRAAAESQRERGSGKRNIPLPMTIAGVLTVLVTLMYEL